MTHQPSTRANRIAYLETELWKAYYHRQWLREFRLLIATHREFFHMGPLTAVRASYESARAAMAFAPLDASDLPKARRYLLTYYPRVRRSLGCRMSAAELAGVELNYWVVHRAAARRRLAEVASGRPADDEPTPAEIEPVVDAFAHLHAALFNQTPERMRESAVYRAQATAVVDRISGRYSPDVPGDWRRVEALLRQAYAAIEEAVGPDAVAWRGRPAIKPS